MKAITLALAAILSLPAQAAVVTWRVDGTARTSVGPLGVGRDPVLTALPDEPDAWQQFSYDTNSGFLSVAFDFGTIEGHAAGPISGQILQAEFGGPPIAGWALADWITPYGTINDRRFFVGSDAGSHIADGNVLVYNFTATDSYLTQPRAALAFQPPANPVPEPGSAALVLLGLALLARGVRHER